MTSHRYITVETGERHAEAVGREVQDILQAETGQIPEITRYAGNIYWTLDEADVSDLHDLDVPRLVKTWYSDTVNAGSGTLFERIDGEFVAVDEIGSPASESDYGEYVPDYFHINYGIRPVYSWYAPSSSPSGTSKRPAGRTEWRSLLSPAPSRHPSSRARQSRSRG